MSKSAHVLQLIWLVRIEPEHDDKVFRVLPKDICRIVRRISLPVALKRLESTQPALIFLAGQPGKALQSAMAQINQIQPGLPVLVLSQWRNASDMRSWFSRYFVEMARGTPPNRAESTNAYRLSARELDILRFMVKGLIKKEIAEQLSISYHTVDNHERNIFRKMNIHTRSAAVAKALIEKIC
jgi:DNA-binding CsgD family transcriptional regulator